MRLRRLSTLAAATLFTPVLVVMPTPAQGEPTQKPVETTQKTAPLGDPNAAPVGDGERATASDKALAERTTPEVGDSADLQVLGATGRQEVPSDLAVIGVTWEGETPLAVQYRTETDKGWGPWQAVDTETESDAVEVGASTKSGSDPVPVIGAKAVQARILGAPGSTPRDPQLSVIDPGEGDGDANTGAQAGAAHAAASRPTIHSRAEWGADESLRRGTPSYGEVRGAIVHHTAGTNDYTPSQVPAILRGIYAFHVKDRGWSDVGYNFLVDKWGRVWEGRYGGTDKALIGAQASGFNSVTMGISVMGDYRTVQPTKASIDAVTRVIAWKASIHGFDPLGRFSWNGSTYRNVSGHKDVGNTTCPGLIYDYLPSIAARAAALKGGLANDGGAHTPGTTRPPATAPYSTGGAQASDALMLNSRGNLFAVAPQGTTAITSARRLSTGNWKGYDNIVASPDLTGDRRADVVSLSRSNGRLYVHRGTSSGVGTRTLVGRGWTGFSQIVAPGDVSGDGRADLVAVEQQTGNLYLYRGDGKGGVSGRTQIGRAWGVYRHLAAVGDISGDGNPDLVGITADGRAYLHAGNGKGGWVRGGKVSLGTVGGYTRVVGMTGASRLLAIKADGTADVLTRSGNTLRATKAGPHFRGLTVFGG